MVKELTGWLCQVTARHSDDEIALFSVVEAIASVFHTIGILQGVNCIPKIHAVQLQIGGGLCLVSFVSLKIISIGYQYSFHVLGSVALRPQMGDHPPGPPEQDDWQLLADSAGWPQFSPRVTRGPFLPISPVIGNKHRRPSSREGFR